MFKWQNTEANIGKILSRFLSTPLFFFRIDKSTHDFDEKSYNNQRLPKLIETKNSSVEFGSARTSYRVQVLFSSTWDHMGSFGVKLKQNSNFTVGNQVIAQIAARDEGFHKGYLRSHSGSLKVKNPKKDKFRTSTKVIKLLLFTTILSSFFRGRTR